MLYNKNIINFKKESEELNMKTYTIYFVIKANCTENYFYMNVEAKNQKEACQEVKNIIKKQTGRNAFRPSTTPFAHATPEEWKK